MVHIHKVKPQNVRSLLLRAFFFRNVTLNSVKFKTLLNLFLFNPIALLTILKINMKLYMKFNSSIACKKIIEEQLEKLNIHFEYKGFAEIEVDDAVSRRGLSEINASLCDYGIEIIENQKSILVQRIKDTITEMVYMEEKPPISNSAYISDKLKERYNYLASVFSEVTHTSIENFIILQKTERAKQLIKTNQLSFTEIAYMLNYSSVAHFSTQFKGTIGITPSTFQRILNRRHENNQDVK
jgi:AraC-like DNA-binding protein